MNYITTLVNHTAVFFTTDIFVVEEIEIENPKFNLEAIYSLANRVYISAIHQLFGGHHADLVFDKNQRQYKLIDYNSCPERASKYNIIVSLILVIPCILIGTVVKGAHYIASKSMREQHRIIVLHRTPIPTLSLGSQKTRLSGEQIVETCNEAIEKFSNHTFQRIEEGGYNPKLCRKVETLFVYPQNNVQMDEGDTKAWKKYFKPNKIIVIGDMMPRQMTSSYKKRHPHQSGGEDWHAVSTEQAALADVPPRISRWSLQRFQRMYFVNSPEK